MRLARLAVFLVVLGATLRTGAAPHPDDVLETQRDLLERVARGGRPTPAERRTLRSMLWSESLDVVSVGAWALTRTHDRGALADMRKRLHIEERKEKGRPFHLWDTAAMLRLAPIRLQKRSTVESRRLWESLLRHDVNATVRAEAAKEIVALRHPRALELLRVILAQAHGKRWFDGNLLTQTVFALGRLALSDTVGELKGVLGSGNRPGGVGYVAILQLEQCQTLFREPCSHVKMYMTVDAYARRALEAITGESWTNRWTKAPALPPARQPASASQPTRAPRR
ncbi:MAG: hypothetical protein HY906_28290 [Deltaproteobacteria bacterium]|nr:hypothetical protein [Deltaproteobacteria bacterium]